METTETATESEAPQESPTPRFRGRGEHGGASAIVLGPRDVLEGKLTVDGDIRIQGRLQGELTASGDVNVEQGASVQAPIEAKNLTVRGQLEGDVNVKERLLVAGSGVVNGNVRISRLAIEDGATLNGNVQMQSGSGGGRSRGAEHNPESPG